MDNQQFKILFVDNSKTFRLFIEKIMKKRGYEIDCASNGPDAISMVEQFEYNLVIMDLFMPTMNGYEAARKIRQLENPSKDVPIIGLTGSTDQEDLKLATSHGMNDVIVKSDDYKSLFDLIDNYKNQASS